MFSKSKTKRFQDSGSCAPPVGTYNLPDVKDNKLTSFQKSNRFKDFENCDVGEDKSNSSLPSFIKPSLHSQNPSTCKKKPQQKSLSRGSSNKDICGSLPSLLQADFDFQTSKIDALQQRIANLEKQIKDTKKHANGIEESNVKLLDLLEEVRGENVSLQKQNEELIQSQNQLNDGKDKLNKKVSENDVELQRKIELLRLEEEKEKEDLRKKLETAQNLNCDFREQLESIEHSMTDNLRSLSEKYLSLEDTLGNVQKDYRNRLERSNSLLEKTKEAHEKSKEDLISIQNVNEALKENINKVSIESFDLKDKLDFQESLIQEYKEKEEQYIEQIRKVEATSKQQLNNLLMEVDEIRKIQKELKTQYQHLVNEYNEYRKTSTIQHERMKMNYTEHEEKLKLEYEELEKEFKIYKEKSKLEIEGLENEYKNIKLKSEIQFKELQNQYEINTADLKLKIEDLHQQYQETNEKSQQEKTDLQNEFMKIQNEVAKQLMETQIKLSNAEAKNSSAIDEEKYKSLLNELETWRKKYNDLETKVSPFLNEIDRFAMEREHLLNENRYTQEEMNKLSEKYAQILGHQNNKQKIHHIRKLKEENLSLKSEVMKLRSIHRQSLKNKSTDGVSKVKMFLSENKENLSTSTKPLKSSENLP